MAICYGCRENRTYYGPPDESSTYARQAESSTRNEQTCSYVGVSMSEAAGVKLDTGKVMLHTGCLAYFPRALEAVAEVSEFGANTYTWDGWRSVPDGMRRYSNALARHDSARSKGEYADAASKLSHLAHRAWNALATLELECIENESKQQQSVQDVLTNANKSVAAIMEKRNDA